MRARVAIITDQERHIERKDVEPFLPPNYAVVFGEGGNLYIVGVDHAGWTLDDYVLPRLASGLIFAREIDSVPLEDSR